MELESISKSIREFWHFLYAPAVVFAFMAGIAWFIGEDALHRIGLVPKLRGSFVRANKSRKMLEFYGLNKLMPLVSLFLLLFFLQAVSVLSVLIGQALPVHLSHTEARLFLHIADRDRLAMYWEKHPEAVCFSDLAPILRKDAKVA